MRVLIVNPNTSQGVTARIDAAAQAVACPGDGFTTVSAAFGPELIVTETDAAEAARGVLAVLQAHDAPLDGIVLASFGDTGAEAVRAAFVGIPVVGLAGAAFAAARAFGGRSGVVTFGPGMVPGLRDMAERHGMTDSLFGITALPAADPGDPGTVQQRHGPALADLARDMAAAGGLSSIILGGGPLAGLARTIAPQVPVPVIDGVQAALGLVRAASKSG